MTPQELLLTLVPVITILVQILKPVVKALPGQSDNNAAVQLFAVALNLAAVFGFAALFGILTPASALVLFTQGVVQGVGSVGLYHVMPAGASSATAPAPVVPAGGVVPAEPPAAP